MKDLPQGSVYSICFWMTVFFVLKDAEPKYELFLLSGA